MFSVAGKCTKLASSYSRNTIKKNLPYLLEITIQTPRLQFPIRISMMTLYPHMQTGKGLYLFYQY